MAGDLTYFWIPSPDPERGAVFYRGLFGWTLEPREQGDGYGISSTTVYGGIVGGREGTRPFLYFATDDVENAADAVREFGGHAGEVHEFSEGASVDCRYDDVEFGIFRPAGFAGAEASNQLGDLGYFVVPVGDAAEARSFYGSVLGWEYDHDDVDAAYHHVVNCAPPGGLYTEQPAPRPIAFFRVADVDASSRRVRELGGEAGEVLESSTGLIAACRDDQGVEFSLWQPAAGY